MKEELIKTITDKGFWRILFRPLVSTQKIENLGACRDIVENNKVSLRGWSYPYCPPLNSDDAGIEPLNNCYQGWIDSRAYKEFWRMYQTGQFLHYRALKEDWLKGDPLYGSLQHLEPGSSLEVINTTYQVTEIFEFLSRLAGTGIYDEGVHVEITLKNTAGRVLFINEFNRAPFMEPRKAGANDIPFSQECTREEIAVGPKDLALKAILYIFERFSWHNPPIETIKMDQENLLAGRP